MRALSFVALLAALLVVVRSGAQPPAKDKPDPKAKADPKAKRDEPEPKFNMKMTAKDIVPGSHVSGPKVGKDDVKDRVIYIDYWGIKCPPCVQSLAAAAALNTELGDYGLLVIGSHVQDGLPEAVRAAAPKATNFAITIQTRVKGDMDAGRVPHCILFDHKGGCAFRGEPKDAESHIRAAVGKALLEGAKKEQFAPALEPAVKDLKAGKPIAGVLAKVAALRTAKGQAGEDAQALLDALTAHGHKKLKEAEDLVGSSPAEAFLLIEKFPATFKNTPLAAKATEVITKLKKDRAVTAELNARPVLEAVKKLDQQLPAAPGDDPKKGDYQKANAITLRQLKTKIQQMKSAWPDAPSTKEAAEIADRLGIEIK